MQKVVRRRSAFPREGWKVRPRVGSEIPSAGSPGGAAPMLGQPKVEFGAFAAGSRWATIRAGLQIAVPRNS